MNEEAARDLLVTNRTVFVKSGEHTGRIGFIQEYDPAFDLYMISNGNWLSGHEWFELEPLFTLGQVVDVKLADQQPGSDLSDKVQGFGMTSDDLAEYTNTFIADCVNRIKGVGNTQYSEDGYQRFEAMDLDDLFEYIEEEIRDIPNYCAMLFIRIRRLREALKVVDIIPEEEEEFPHE